MNSAPGGRTDNLASAAARKLRESSLTHACKVEASDRRDYDRADRAAKGEGSADESISQAERGHRGIQVQTPPPHHPVTDQAGEAERAETNQRHDERPAVEGNNRLAIADDEVGRHRHTRKSD